MKNLPSRMFDFYKFWAPIIRPRILLKKLGVCVWNVVCCMSTKSECGLKWENVKNVRPKRQLVGSGVSHMWGLAYRIKFETVDLHIKSFTTVGFLS